MRAWGAEMGESAVMAAQFPMRGQYPPKPQNKPRSNRACLERCAIRCRSAQSRCSFAPGKQRPGFCTAQAIQCRSSCAAGCG